MASGERDPGGTWPLGPVVGAALAQAGWSDREAGKRAGIAAATVKAMVTGQRPNGDPTKPQSSAIIKLARALRLDVNEALELAGYDPRVENPDFKPNARTGRPPKSQRAVGEMIERLTPRQYDAVVEVIESMLWPDHDQEPVNDGVPQAAEGIEGKAHATSRRTSSEPQMPLGGVTPLPGKPVRTPAPDPASEEAGQGRGVD
jgi:hypothetical protein